jgi:hypothetical protein
MQAVGVTSSVFVTITLQVPVVPQLRQAPQLATEQQTPSTQLPETQAVLEPPQPWPLTDRQLPVELQLLVPLQVLPVVSSAPATVIVHIPVLPQLRQVGQAEVMQQTPSRQVNPAWHSLVVPQPTPAAFLAWQPLAPQ